MSGGGWRHARYPRWAALVLAVLTLSLVLTQVVVPATAQAAFPRVDAATGAEAGVAASDTTDDTASAAASVDPTPTAAESSAQKAARALPQAEETPAAASSEEATPKDQPGAASSEDSTPNGETPPASSKEKAAPAEPAPAATSDEPTPTSDGSDAASAEPTPTPDAVTQSPSATSPGATDSPSATPSPSAPQASASPSSGTAPTIVSDLADYPPGGKVTLTGSGWQLGESVTIVVNDTIGQSWKLAKTVTADAEGRITLVFTLPDYYVSDYDVIATGVASGVARTTFTDAPIASNNWNYWVESVTPTADGVVGPGSTITYQLRARQTSTWTATVTGAAVTFALTGPATITSATVGSNGTVSAITPGTTTSLTWSVAALSYNTARTITVVVTLDSNASGGVAVTGTATDNDDRGSVPSGEVYTATHWSRGPAFSCTTGTSYSLSNTGALYRVTLAGSTPNTPLVPVGSFSSSSVSVSSVNGLAIARDGSAAYAFNRDANGIDILKFDMATGQPSRLVNNYGVSPSTWNFMVAGAVNPVDDKYYFGGFGSGTNNGNRFFLWSYDPAAAQTSTNPRLLGYIIPAGASTTGNSDIAFDAKGNLYLAFSVQNGLQNLNTVAASSLPPASPGQGTQIPTVGDPVTLDSPTTTYNGIAFDNTGKLIAQDALPDGGATYIRTLDANTGTTLGGPTSVGSLSGSDMASCLYPGSVTLKKNLPSGRAVATDQFTLSVARQTTTLATETTSGSVSTAQTRPVLGVQGASYTLSEVAAGTPAADLTKYDSRYECVIGATTVASGTVRSFSYDFPAPTGASGPDVVCTFTNIPKNGAATWAKSDAATGALLAGSVWTLTGPTGASSTTRTVSDCVGSTVSACSGMVDQNWQAGQFSVPDLLWGEYTLTEATPPPGYIGDGLVRTRTITAAALTADFQVIPNTKIATASVTISKRVQDANGANEVAGHGWVMGATLPTGSTATISPSGTQTTSTSGSVPSPWTITFPSATALVDVTVTETQQTGYVFVAEGSSCTVTPKSGAPRTVPLPGVGGNVPNVAPGDAVACTFVNKQSPGSASWQKVAQAATFPLLGGSEWTLTGPGIAASPATVVTDCVKVAPETCPTGAYKDQDPAAGEFRLDGLVWGSYTLIESKAPLGYRLDTTPRQFVISATALNADPVPGSPFKNEQISVPAIPLTGGPSTDSFIISGAVLLALAAAAAWRQRRRVENPPI